MIRTLAALAVLISTTAIDLPAIETGGGPWWIDIVESARGATYIFVGQLGTKTGSILITRFDADGSESSETVMESGTFWIEEMLLRAPGQIKIQPGQMKIQASWWEPPKEQQEGSPPERVRLLVGDRGVWFVREEYILGCYVFKRVPLEGLDVVRLVLSEMKSLGLPVTKKEESEREARWAQLKKRVWQRLYVDEKSPLWTPAQGVTDSSHTK